MRIWLIIFAMGIVTFLFRFIFIWGLDRFGEPSWLRSLLKYVPHAALSGILFGSVFHGSQDIAEILSDHRIPAIIVASIVEYKWNNMIATIFAGMLVVWILPLFT